MSKRWTAGHYLPHHPPPRTGPKVGTGQQSRRKDLSMEWCWMGSGSQITVIYWIRNNFPILYYFLLLRKVIMVLIQDESW